MPDTHRIPVHVRGTFRGVLVDADGSVRLVEDVLSIQVDDREHTIRVERVDGVVWEPPVLTLHVGSATTELTGHPGLPPLGLLITASALALPEFTRTMRGLGTRRGHLGSDHDRFFAGLLAARRAAEGFVEPESRLAAFDARRLSQSLTTLLGELASERFPQSAPDRRALEAELQECAERVYAALDALGDAAEEVRLSANASRLARWRGWTWAAHRVFEEADRCWIAMVGALAAAPLPAPRRSFWRRARGFVAFLPLAHAVVHTAMTAGS